VLTDPNEDGKLVIANVTSQEQGKDQSCVLDPGDHPFITKESVMNYAEAVESKEAQIIEATRRRLFQSDLPVSPEVLAKIQAGALASPQTESRVKNAVKVALGQ